MTADEARAQVAALPIWRGPVDPVPLGGGITNHNFTVDEGGRRWVVRVGGDIPWHGIVRANELAASRAAAAAGLSPTVRHAEPGILVLEHLDARPLGEADVRDPANRARLVELIRRCHHEVARHLRGPGFMFWVFHVVRDYAHTLREAGSPHTPRLPALAALAERLERAVGPVEIVFGHNDLLPANILDDGSRLWLVDWEYAGFNSPLFDLGGLASNALMPAADAHALLEVYLGRPLDDATRYRAQAMTCASLLREAMWSMVSELRSTLAFDYAAYTRTNLDRLDAALAVFDAMEQA